MALEDQLLEDFRYLTPERRKKLAYFAQNLRQEQTETGPTKLISDSTEATENGPSFLDLAQKYVGILKDGPPDLSTNKAYLADYGK
jgi:hypothetical protein